MKCCQSAWRSHPTSVWRVGAAGVLALGFLVVSCGDGGKPAPSAGVSATVIPDEFVTTVDNPFFPLTPGTRFIYEGDTEDGHERDVVDVLHDTVVILNVRCTEVHDVLYADGEIVEDTLDWYAQDKQGNVWYFGEDTRELEAGKVVSTEGSWVAGAAGAKPGILMEAHPKVGDSYRQEFSPGVAEDEAAVIGMGLAVTVPFGGFSGVLRTRETTRLEPGIAEDKYYAPRIGLVWEHGVTGGASDSRLTGVQHF